MSAIIREKKKSMDPRDDVGPKLVCIRFSGWKSDPSESEPGRYKALVRQVLALMNVDRNSVYAGDGRRRVDIAYLEDKRILEFSFFYLRPAWAHRAEAVAKVLEALHSNCKVDLEAINE